MFAHLLSAIEADINRLAAEQDKKPQDVQIAAQRLQLKELAMDYVNLENRYREIASKTSVY